MSYSGRNTSAGAGSTAALATASAAALATMGAGALAWKVAGLHAPGADAEMTLAMIKPDAVAAGHAPEIIKLAKAKGFAIIAKKESTLTEEQVDAFYAEHKDKPFFPDLKTFMTSGPIVALALRRVAAIPAWRALMGPTKVDVAKSEAPDSIRARFGTDTTRNASHGSDSPASAARELAFHFPELETTLAMIKPDAVASGAANQILQKIRAAGFTIVGQRKFTFSEAEVDDFYGEHRDRPFFPALKAFMTSGPSIALALRKANAILEWRAMLGPTSTAAAKAAAPGSLRALFGADATRNAAHGSDSYGAAARELYFHFPPLETTLALVKPDAVTAGAVVDITNRILSAGFRISAAKRIKLTEAQVEDFYAEHRDRPFFPELKAFMTSGYTAVLALQCRDAIAAWRRMQGPTDTAKAKAEAAESVRALYGTDATRNATHGSDSPAAAARELAFFFPRLSQLFPYWGYAWV